ncbi:MAG: GspH/FimT family pseudopilin [Gemmatimonadaceae bacterium]|jgi:prepilin-type N-terminal cleavage/methylation domain-containing protein|nr:GspH/FimT family pseudopilin [Gemmatimonadaceae bacterium]
MRTAPRRRGFSLVELCVVVVILGILGAIAAPKLRITPRQAADGGARQLLQDIELARTRAFASRAAVRIVATDSTYRFFLDHNRDSTILENNTERDAFGTGAERRLDPVLRFGRGTLPRIAGDTATPLAGAVRRFRVDPRGLPVPFGSSFTLYVRHKDDPRSATAVTVTPAGNVRLLSFIDGAWK